VSYSPALKFGLPLLLLLTLGIKLGLDSYVRFRYPGGVKETSAETQVAEFLSRTSSSSSLPRTRSMVYSYCEQFLEAAKWWLRSPHRAAGTAT